MLEGINISEFVSCKYISKELIYSLFHSVLRRKAASQSDKPVDKKEEESQNVSGILLTLWHLNHGSHLYVYHNL